jgi:hypothetical protein
MVRSFVGINRFDFGLLSPGQYWSVNIEFSTIAGPNCCWFQHCREIMSSDTFCLMLIVDQSGLLIGYYCCLDTIVRQVLLLAALLCTRYCWPGAIVGPVFIVARCYRVSLCHYVG